jgi:hypothetical protein
MMAEQTAKRLYQVRGKLYELLANCIPPELLLRSLLVELLKKLDDELKVGALPFRMRGPPSRMRACHQHRPINSSPPQFPPPPPKTQPPRPR